MFPTWSAIKRFFTESTLDQLLWSKYGLGGLVTLISYICGLFWNAPAHWKFLLILVSFPATVWGINGLLLWKDRWRDRRASKQQESHNAKDRALLEAADTQIKSLTTSADSYKQEAEAKERELQQLREQYSTSEDLRKNAERRAEEKTKEYDKVKLAYLACKQSRGRWMISAFGTKREPLNLSLAVQFMDIKDADLAKRIREYFITDIPASPYERNVRPLGQIDWFENPSKSARVVMFSYHPSGAGIKYAFNHNELIEEKVENIDLQASTLGIRMDAADITFVIFPKKGTG